MCEAFDAIGTCAQKASIEEINLCSVGAARDLVNKMSGEKLEISTSQREKMQSVTTAYSQCISLSITEANAIQNAGGLGTATTGLSTTTTDLEAKQKAATEKFKSAFKVCLSTYTSKGKEILECD